MDIVKNRKLPVTQEDSLYLLTFFTFQFTRTDKSKRETAELVQKAVDKLIKPLMHKDPELKEKGVTNNFIDKIEITYPGLFGYKLGIGLLSAPKIY